MADGITLINDLNELTASLSGAIHNLAKYGKDYAEKEAAYKVRLMQESLKLRDSGMAVTLIDNVVYGICAEERRQRDIAEAYYKTALENINAIKLRIRIVDNQIEREWGRRQP